MHLVGNRVIKKLKSLELSYRESWSNLECLSVLQINIQRKSKIYLIIYIKSDCIPLSGNIVDTEEKETY